MTKRKKKSAPKKTSAKKQTPPSKITPKKSSLLYRVILILIAIFLFLSLVSFNSHDLAILDGGVDGLSIHNWMGVSGAILGRFLLLFLGLAAYPVTLFLLFLAIQAFRPEPYINRKYFYPCFFMFALGVSMLFAMYPESFVSSTSALGIGSQEAAKSALSGGVLGQFFCAPQGYGPLGGIIRVYIGDLGTILISLGLIFLGSIFLWNRQTLYSINKFLSMFKYLKSLGKVFELAGKMKREKTELEDDNVLDRDKFKIAQLKARALEQTRKRQAKEELENIDHYDEYEDVIDAPPVQKRKAVKSPSTIISRKQPVKNISKPKSNFRKSSSYKLPSLNFLNDIQEGKVGADPAVKIEMERLQQTLSNFDIDAKVTTAISGPRVTRIEVIPAPGVKLQRIVNLEANIKLSLKAESIRILAPIPGRDAVGIEIPNKTSSPVSYKKILAGKSWKSNGGDIPIVLGKGVSGESVLVDLAKTPHLLIAGATGSGKSVCMNTLIMSLLYRFSPEELKLVMVDPKVVEFEMYKDLPHLITPIVNEPKKVPLVLNWCVNEMEKRYKILAKARVKNLQGYNSRDLSKAKFNEEGEPLPDTLPYIVVIIDELADIMMSAKKEVETSIARIAQKARAVGIHLVLATQRPSKEIITGVIKANLPTRIAFRVTSVVDSRVILDHKGAESLLGKGDMLFIPPGTAKLERIQGAMLDDDEIEKAVDFIAGQAEQQFDEKVAATPDNIDSGETDFSGATSEIGDGGRIDSALMQQAIGIIRRERKASTSYIQRRLRIGYNKAAEIIDELEAQGIIGPQIGSSRREIFIDTDE